MQQQLTIGTKVHYIPAQENGIIKSFSSDKLIIFVVYHCDNDWNNYSNYTGAATYIQDIKLGWI